MILNENIISLKIAIPLLKSAGLFIPDNIDYTIGIYEGKNLIGTGSLSKDVLLGIAVKKEYQGLNITSKIVTNLIMKCFERNIDNFFIFTKYTEKEKFIDLGFNQIASVKDKIVLLEYDRKGIDNFKDKLKKISSPIIGEKSCIVMNCNPFTNGHLYLIEKAASENDHLFVLLVEEDLSVFPYKSRLNLVVTGISHLKNVTVISGGKYTISSATFPTYFIKKDFHTELYASLDLDIFINNTAKALNVKKRYIGEEPNCPVTSTYNTIIKKMLPKSGIDVIEIPRLKTGNNIISASKVRLLIKNGKIKETFNYLPKTTYDFILSKDAEKIINKIQRNNISKQEV